MFISDKKTRSLLKDFCKKGLEKDHFFELRELLHTHAPSLLLLLQFIKPELPEGDCVVTCPQEWSKLIIALACPSPVCALVHPSDRVFNLLKKIISDDDFTKYPASMEALQEEIPVLFDVLKVVKHLPRKNLTPLIHAIIKKADAPFVVPPEISDTPTTTPLVSDLSYFPYLPPVRVRDTYECDCHAKQEGCTKQSSGHPSLLPGVFTLFCPHGMNYTIEPFIITF